MDKYNEFKAPQIWASKSLVSLLETQNSSFDKVLEIGQNESILKPIILERLNVDRYEIYDLYDQNLLDEFDEQNEELSTLKLPKNLDLIISSSYFQWLSPLDELSQKLGNALNDDGILAFSTLTKGTLKEISSFFGANDGFKTPEQIERIFGRNFDILAMRNSSYETDFNSLDELLLSLKETGINSFGGYNFDDFTKNELEKHLNYDYRLSANYAFVVARKVSDDL